MLGQSPPSPLRSTLCRELSMRSTDCRNSLKSPRSTACPCVALTCCSCRFLSSSNSKLSHLCRKEREEGLKAYFSRCCVDEDEATGSADLTCCSCCWSTGRKSSKAGTMLCVRAAPVYTRTHRRQMIQSITASNHNPSALTQTLVRQRARRQRDGVHQLQRDGIHQVRAVRPGLQQLLSELLSERSPELALHQAGEGVRRTVPPPLGGGLLQDIPHGVGDLRLLQRTLLDLQQQAEQVPGGGQVPWAFLSACTSTRRGLR